MKLRKILLEMLNEVSFDQLKAQFVDTGKVTQETFDKIKNLSNDKSVYATWLIKKVANNEIKTEDIYKFKDYFKIFDKNKDEFPIKDLGVIKKKEDVDNFVSKAEEILVKFREVTGLNSSKDLVSLNGVKELNEVGIKFLGLVDGYQCFEIPSDLSGDQNAFKIYRKYLAKCKDWSEENKISLCTMGSIKRFNEYLNKGPFFVFFNMSDDKSPYQFCYEDNQFMDKNNEPLI